MPKTSPAPPPPSAGFVGFLYNKEKGEVLGRTGTSWAKIGLFYVIYYSGLAAFFIALLSIFLYTFTDNKAPGDVVVVLRETLMVWVLPLKFYESASHSCRFAARPFSCCVFVPLVAA